MIIKLVEAQEWLTLPYHGTPDLPRRDATAALACEDVGRGW